jgi:hypothetical protein
MKTHSPQNERIIGTVPALIHLSQIGIVPRSNAGGEPFSIDGIH